MKDGRSTSPIDGKPRMHVALSNFKRSLEEASVFSNGTESAGEAPNAHRLGTAVTSDGAPVFPSARIQTQVLPSGRKRHIPELILPMDRLHDEIVEAARNDIIGRGRDQEYYKTGFSHRANLEAEQSDFIAIHDKRNSDFGPMPSLPEHVGVSRKGKSNLASARGK